MPLDEARLLALAASISDGSPVDWDSEERQAAGADERALLRQLRVVSAIAGVHRDPLPAAWGQLEIRERLGAGAFGTVYLARDTRLERDVALKLIRTDAADPAVLREGRLLARVRHPHVVAVHGAERIGDQVGIWMEHVAGRTLEAWLGESGPLGAREAALVGLDLCRALAAVHAVDLVHRDVKAQNVMREDGGRIVLMDFGAGADLSALERREAERPSGTPLYMAPELLRGEPASPRSDLYALGVLLYHLVTGSYPVLGRTLGELRQAHAAGRSTPLGEARPDLPPSFVHVVERALAADPHERCASAGRMEQALNAALGVAPAPTRREPPAWPLYTAAIVLGGTLLGAVALLALRGRSTPGLRVEASLFHRGAGSTLDLPLRDGDAVSRGDRLHLELESAVPLYVYVVNRDAHGAAFALYPKAADGSAPPLAAGVKQRLPDAAGYWVVTSSGGKESFVVVAAASRLPALEHALAELARPERLQAKGRGVGAYEEGAPDRDERQLQATLRELTDRAARGGAVWVHEFVVDNP
ncbi:MAG TPA: protein kinase [Candidatus Polarisedimenticolaceae bacterium]|nr:protein kinase [Candidatus Polarisedimenticolaceae bacterium]